MAEAVTQEEEVNQTLGEVVAVRVRQSQAQLQMAQRPVEQWYEEVAGFCSKIQSFLNALFVAFSSYGGRDENFLHLPRFSLQDFQTN